MKKELTKALNRRRPVEDSTTCHCRQIEDIGSQRAQKSSPLVIVIRRMARKACGLPEAMERKALQSLAIPQDLHRRPNRKILWAARIA